MNIFYTSDGPMHSDQIAVNFPEEWEYFRQIPCELELKFEVSGKRIQLQNEFGTPIYIDVDKKLRYHQQFFYKNSIYKQPLAKALGVKKDASFEVLDATAGLMGDSLLMSSFGVRVTALERNPVVALLIVNALKNAQMDVKITFRHQSALDLNLREKYPVIFFDPMYGEKNSKAAPKKEMQVFRKLVGEDFDRIDVAKHLLNLTDRLVIKRSIKASSLLDRPTITFSGKSTCYDVYLSSNGR